MSNKPTRAGDRCRRFHRPPPGELTEGARLLGARRRHQGAGVRSDHEADEFELLDLRRWENCLRGDARRRRGLRPGGRHGRHGLHLAATTPRSCTTTR